MFVRKRTSKKAKKGYTWTVYIDYEDSYGVKQRYTKGGFQEKSEALNHGIEKQQELKQGIEIKLKDRYGQEISKMIQYDLIAKWHKKYIKYKKPEKSQVFLAF